MRLSPALARFDAWLSRHRWYLYAVALLLSLAIAGLLTRGLIISAVAWLRDPGAIERRTIDLPKEAAAPPAAPTVTPADPRDDDAAPATPASFAEPETPAIDWQSEARILRAAIALAEDGRSDAALDLLLSASTDREVWIDVAVAGYTAVQQRLREHLPEAWLAVRRWWEALPPDARQAHFPLQAESRANALSEALAATPEDPAAWSQAIAALPVSVRATLLHNLGVDGVQATGMPANVVKLLLQLELAPDALAQPILQASHLRQRVPYPDHLPWFVAAFDAQIVPALLREEFAIARRQLLEAQMEDRALVDWWLLVWDEPFGRTVQTLGPASTPAELREAWDHLRDLSRTLWARHLARELGRRHEYLPRHILQRSSWLQEAYAEPDKAHLLSLVRRHPLWQRLLNGFDYQAADARLPEILADLRASAYSTSIRLALFAGLKAERAAFSHGDFPWARLAEEAKIADAVPDAREAGLTRKLPFNPPIRPSARSWPEARSADIYRSLQSFAARQATLQLETWYRRLAEAYAINRALKLDEDEARQYPQNLTTDPLERIQLPTPP